MSIKSSQIKLNYPNKVLPVSITEVTGTEYWPFANGEDDQWYAGSASPRYYRWSVTFTVTTQTHGSHLTRAPFEYNGLDVIVGDWIAGATDGKCLKIISIASKTTTTVTVIAEDWLRYNTMKATTGQGAFNTGSAVVFSLNETGFPMLDPLPTSTSPDFFAQVMSRFQYLNPQLNYVLEQENHGFEKGDIISVTNAGFVLANADTASKMIGTVTESGPGPNHFIILPNNRIVDLDPNIPGNQGDFVYLDSATGHLTNTSGGRLIYLSIRGPIPTVLTGNTADPVIPAGYTIAINGYDLTLTSGNANVSLTEIVNQINTATPDHDVIADTVIVSTSVASNAAGTAYGLVGGYVPFSASFDNGSGPVVVNFTSNGSQYPTVSTPEDMAFDINAAGIPNLIATATATELTLEETNGNAITIASITPDTGGNPFVGASNISGLPASVSAATGSKLQLTRNNGGEIYIYEDSDVFQTNTGIVSGHTGSLPLAMNIEQGIRTGGITVVDNIGARDALSPAAGDMAYVINKGDGEWGLYLYTGSTWEITGTQDSATVDAKTLVNTYTMPLSGNVTVGQLGNISAGRKITTVSVDVVNSLSGYSSTPSVTIGTATDQALFLDENSSDLTDIGTYFGSPEYLHDPVDGQDLVVEATITHNGATSGEFIVKVTYI